MKFHDLSYFFFCSTFNIGCVVSIFDTLVFDARQGVVEGLNAINAIKKKSKKSNGAPWIYASSYVPLICSFGILIELGVLQFKIPNEHKFDRLLASTQAVFDENEYISTIFSEKVFASSHISTGCQQNQLRRAGCQQTLAKKLKVALIFIEWFE